MARKQDEKNLLMEDELAAAFLNDDDLVTSDTSAPAPVAEDNWEDEAAVSVESGGCSLFCGAVQPQRDKRKREHRQRAAMGFIAASFPAGEIPAR